MTEYYSEQHKQLHAVDCIIFGFDMKELKLLLVNRKFEPCKGKWSLMGGFVRDSESVDQAASRVLNELTGLSDVYMHQVYTYGEIDRDPGERVICTAYFALINVAEYDRELVELHNASWVSVNELPELIFDHARMVDDARKMMRRLAGKLPIGFNLLPELFSMPQLQSLYEAIMGEELDKRNFRKRVAEMPYIEKTAKIDKSGSRRGAHLYRLNEELYKQTQNFKL